MTYKPPHLAFVITDAVSFNLLMAGQLEYLKARGVQITLFCGGSEDEIRKLRIRDVGLIRSIPLKRRPNLFCDLFALTTLIFFMLRTRFDAVITSTPKAMLLGTLAATLACQRQRIIIIRGRVYENKGGLSRWFYLQLDKLAITCATKVLFISRSLQLSFESDGLRLGMKGSILGCGSSNGVDVKRFRPVESDQKKQKIRSVLNLPADSFIALSVGRLNADKGIFEAAEIIKQIGPRQDLIWLFVGSVEDESAAALLRSLQHHNVRLIARATEIERYFQAADLHIFLSHREGFGNVAIEAAASAVPTFAFNVVGVRDSVMDGFTGRLFERDDITGLREAIEEAVANRGTWGRCYPEMRSMIVERFSSEQVWERYAEVFIGGDSSPRRS